MGAYGDKACEVSFFDEQGQQHGRPRFGSSKRRDPSNRNCFNRTILPHEVGMVCRSAFFGGTSNSVKALCPSDAWLVGVMLGIRSHVLGLHCASGVMKIQPSAPRNARTKAVLAASRYAAVGTNLLPTHLFPYWPHLLQHIIASASQRSQNCLVRAVTVPWSLRDRSAELAACRGKLEEPRWAPNRRVLGEVMTYVTSLHDAS